MPYPTISQRFIIPDLPSAEEILPYLREIDRNRWYSNFGPLTNRLENNFAVRMKSAHGLETAPVYCTSFASGSHALSVGLRLRGIGPGKRVLVPVVTFPACPLVVQNLGAEVVFADIDPEKWVLTPETAKNIAQNTKIDAVMPVAIYGIPLPAQKWDDFVAETGIPVVIDAAAAIETQKYPKKALVAHSLHALKPMGIGEGGFLMSPDKESKVTARQISNFGMIDRVSYIGGENAKMSEYHAAVGLAQLERWEEIKERRRHVFDMYKKALAPFGEAASIHKQLEETVLSCLMIKIKNKNPAGVVSAMIAHGAPAHRTYLPPLYTHPLFENLSAYTAEGKAAPAGKRQALRGGCEMEKTVLGLPFHPFLSEEDILHFAKILQETLSL